MDDEKEALRRRIVELESQLARERSLFAGGPVVVFRWVAADGWPVVYVSDNVEGLFGHSVDDFLQGRVPYASVVHPDDLARVGGEVASYSAAGVKGFEQDYRILHADGGVRWLYDYTAVIRNERGEVTHYDGYVLDISARLEAEAEVRRKDEQLRQGQKMEALGRLAGGTAHDFNNLLTALVGHADRAADLLEPDHPALPSIDRCREIVGRAAELTRHLLAFARRQVLEPRRLDLGALVREARRLVVPLLGEQVDITFDLPDAPTWIRADPSQLEHVLLNLLLNGRDAMPDGGSMLVSVGRRETTDPVAAELQDEVPPGTWVVLSVSDDGTGIDPTIRPRLFEPFWSTKGDAGTGLGLATVYGVVRQSGGHVVVRDAVPRGTVFEVWLPEVRGSTRPSIPPALPASRRPSPDGTEVVLLVEDHDEIRAVTTAALTAHGYSVIAASDGAEALELVGRGTSVDIVVTDLLMPRLGGLALVEELGRRGLHVPVVLVSGLSEAGALPELPARSAFLPKPFRAETLLITVRRLLDR
ncbi:MAG: PAS domain-containing protein [Alphaproteobacteria bacterium]|nr:PAS domain-containing protein [Alphaproteobacteria bacterium]MCB9696338.1 PAS domain-containing protein [Alphaproteobacteria bacterium]